MKKNQTADQRAWAFTPVPLRNAAVALGGAALCCFAACGGDTMTMSSGTLLGPPQGNGVLSPGYAYIASANQQTGTAGTIYQYGIGTDGSLTPLAVASVPTGIDPTAIVADSTGRFVYTVNSGDKTLSQFAIGAGGALTPLLPAPISLTGVPAGFGTYSLSVDPAAPYLYAVASASGLTTIDQFAIGADGTLTPLHASSVNVPVTASGGLTIDPTGDHAYLVGTVTTAGSTASPPLSELVRFAIGPDGALSAFAPVPVAAGSGTAVRIVIAPSGGAAYLLSQCVDTDCDGSVTPYAIASSGVLSAAGATTLTGIHANPVDMVVDGSGTAAYLLVNFMGVDTNTGSINPYTISGAGALSPGMPPSISLTGAGVAVRAFGPDLFVLTGPGSPIGVRSSYLASYSIGSQGELTSLSNTQIAASAPTGMVLVPQR